MSAYTGNTSSMIQTSHFHVHDLTPSNYTVGYTLTTHMTGP